MTELQKNLQSARRKGQECFDDIMNAKDEANKILFVLKERSDDRYCGRDVYGNVKEHLKAQIDSLESKIKALDEASNAVKGALDLLYGLNFSEFIQEEFIIK